MRISVVVAALVVSAVAAARPAPSFSFAVTAHGSALELAFTNPTKQQLAVETHVRAGIDHYDLLAVELVDSAGAKRALTFVETRTKAVPVVEAIAPGATITDRVDLQFWAVRTGNGSAPLAPGDYQVTATWDGVLTSTTKLTIAAPVETHCADAWNTTPRRATAAPSLELLAHQVGTTPVLEVGIHNFDTVTHCVASYIAPGAQSDWLTVTIGKRTLHFDDVRDKAYVVTVELAPGATAWTRWDLAAWAARGRNGKQALPSGVQWLTVGYDATREGDGMGVQLSTQVAMSLP